MKGSIEDRIVFALAPSGNGDSVPLVILGIPLGAWRYMRDGKSHSFDLTKGPMPIPVRLIVFGGMDHASVKATLEKAAFNAGAKGVLDETRSDFKIDPAPQFRLIDAAIKLRDLLIIDGDPPGLSIPPDVDARAFTRAFDDFSSAIAAEAKDGEG